MADALSLRFSRPEFLPFGLSMRPTTTAASATSAVALFALFLFTGTAWVTLTQFIPSGLPQQITTIAVGVIFALVFLLDLSVRVRKPRVQRSAEPLA